MQLGCTELHHSVAWVKRSHTCSCRTWAEEGVLPDACRAVHPVHSCLLWLGATFQSLEQKFLSAAVVDWTWNALHMKTVPYPRATSHRRFVEKSLKRLDLDPECPRYAEDLDWLVSVGRVHVQGICLNFMMINSKKGRKYSLHPASDASADGSAEAGVREFAPRIEWEVMEGRK